MIELDRNKEIIYNVISYGLAHKVNEINYKKKKNGCKNEE